MGHEHRVKGKNSKWVIRALGQFNDRGFRNADCRLRKNLTQLNLLFSPVKEALIVRLNRNCFG